MVGRLAVRMLRRVAVALCGSVRKLAADDGLAQLVILAPVAFDQCGAVLRLGVDECVSACTSAFSPCIFWFSAADDQEPAPKAGGFGVGPP